MKKIIILCIIVSFIFSQDISFINNNWRMESAQHKLISSLSYGYNAALQFYSEKNFIINKNTFFAGGFVFSSINNVGATFERPDFPLFSTARFYRGELILNFDNFNFNIGRFIPDQDPVKQMSIWNKSKITGDGILWHWDINNNFRFVNSIEFLPAGHVSDEVIYERILNFHELVFRHKKISLSLGEISLYTGIGQGINFHNSNPFLPYTINFADSYIDRDPGYQGDNQNNLITCKFEFNILKNLVYKSMLYIDDIQIDKTDRERLADRYLWINELYTEVDNLRFSVQGKLSNPSMGFHGGPFTMLTTYGTELLPHTFGEYYSGHLNIQYNYKSFEVIAHASAIHKAVMDTIPDKLYLWAVQNALNQETIYSADLRVGY